MATSGLGIGVVSGVTSEVGLGDVAGTTVRPVAEVAAVVETTCTSETTAGLARLQPAINETRSRARETTTSVFFFIDSFLLMEKATVIKVHKSYHN